MDGWMEEWVKLGWNLAHLFFSLSFLCCVTYIYIYLIYLPYIYIYLGIYLIYLPTYLHTQHNITYLTQNLFFFESVLMRMGM
ncbi:hypothetical protein GGS21DRAFT_501559 [Xylaria nigripes]|nr:hypothetical protein GGS21DRAFT_501559 [Xylaria nigripes]